MTDRRWLSGMVIALAGCSAVHTADLYPDGAADGEAPSDGSTASDGGGPLGDDAGGTVGDDAGGPVGDDAGGPVGDDAGTTVDGGGTPTDSGFPGCPPDPPPPPPATPCPAACTGGCERGVCTIDCTGESRCDGRDLVCPPDRPCRVICDGVDACDTGSLRCPPGHACTLECRGGNDACGDFTLLCGDGSCAIDCAFDACSGATVECGGGPCSATCEAFPQPDLAGCDGSCGCAPC
jgi:hypothetical protein